MKTQRLLIVPIRKLPQRLALLSCVKILINIFFFLIIFIFTMLNNVENLKHVIYEGFPQVPDHPRLFREDQVILRHEETVEERIVFRSRYY